MVATLPRNIQLKLEQTLGQWQRWRCATPLESRPEVVHLLSPGLSNYSILVDATTQANPHALNARFVIRLDGLNPATVGLCRQTEQRALTLASRAGLAPIPRYYNPDLGALVYDYLSEDPEPITDICAVAELLRAIHRLPALHFRLDLNERIRRYEKHIEHKGREQPLLLRSSRSTIADMIEHSESTADSRVVCHNDLLSANRITSGGSLRAIDWEYCAMGSRWFDLAVVVAGDALSSTDSHLLLDSYLERAATESEKHKLRQHTCIYRFLELLWFSALDDSQERHLQLTDERLDAFEQTLQELST